VNGHNGTGPPEARCRACGTPGVEVFYEAEREPTNSCLLLDTAEEARTYPTGSLRLGLCAACGFVANTAFDPALAEYSPRYEETQAFSGRFVDFASDLARRWVDRYDLAGGTVVEIGCGKGEFLELLIRAGVGRATGIDPGLHPERLDPAVAERITPVVGRFDDAYGDLVGDAVICRHTLEHIAPVAEFMRTVRRAIGDRRPIVLFELPDVERVLHEAAFWDVYYEHCSYFTQGSLARLFRATGFEVLDVSLDYDDQYILVEAVPADAPTGAHPEAPDDVDALTGAVDKFADRVSETLAFWRSYLTGIRRGGGRAVVWGAGSKGVSFLTNLGPEPGIELAVDVNPYKQGRFIAGTGQEIVLPEALRSYRPETVVLMNPIYAGEVRQQLVSLGVDAEVVAI
jgi:hypothetical protein